MIDLSKFDISLSTWPTKGPEVLRYIKENASGPVELEAALKQLSKKVGVSIVAVRKEFLKLENGEGENSAQNEKSPATVVLKLLENMGIELWQTPSRELYASLAVQDSAGSDSYHLEHFKIDSTEFKDLVASLYFQTTGGVIKEDALSDAIRVLKNSARLGQTYELFVRAAWLADRVYIDLLTGDRRIVEVGPDGFRVIATEEAPVRFKRSRHQLPLPIPKKSTDGLHKLLKLLGIKDRGDRTKIIAWIAGALLRKGPYPILILEGEKGAGKSTLAKFLKRLVDPVAATVFFDPKNRDELGVMTSFNHVLVFDNLSRIPPELSDDLSRISTGAGIVKRQLYTDAEAVVLMATRPIIITGIGFGELRDDLMDRAIRVFLRRIDDSERLTDKKLEEEFEKLLPEALGHLLLATSRALRDFEKVQKRLESRGVLPRMSDWAAWVEAAAPVLGLDEGEAIAAYNDTQVGYAAEVVDTNPVARAFRVFYDDLKPGTETEYSTSELYNAVEKAAFPDSLKKPAGWPKTPSHFGVLLTRLLQTFQQSGIEIESRRSSKTKNRRWLVSKPAAVDGLPDKPGQEPASRERGSVTPTEHPAEKAPAVLEASTKEATPASVEWGPRLVQETKATEEAAVSREAAPKEAIPRGGEEQLVTGPSEGVPAEKPSTAPTPLLSAPALLPSPAKTTHKEVASGGRGPGKKKKEAAPGEGGGARRAAHVEEDEEKLLGEEDLAKWLERIGKKLEELNVSPLEITVPRGFKRVRLEDTPKDGMLFLLSDEPVE